jgi:ParB-like chromosome segregation protein Spo0J
MDNLDQHTYGANQQNAGRRFGAEANLTALEAEQVATPPDQQNAGQVVLRKIELCRELFQPRAEDEAHTKDLADALKGRGELEPLLVLRVGKRVILVDGHHRYTAYWRGGWKDKAVPVRCLKGRSQRLLRSRERPTRGPNCP